MPLVKDSVSWHNAMPTKVTLSGKRCPACGETVMCYRCYANGFQFDSHLADFCLVFFSLLFSGST